MKGGRVHRVPLSPRATAIVSEMAKIRHSAFVFPGRKGDRPASNMTMAAVLRRMKHDDVTVHGFRSTFRDWVAQRSAYPREVVEAALAHIAGGVEGAYFRSDLFEKRRALMDDWPNFVDVDLVGVRGEFTWRRHSANFPDVEATQQIGDRLPGAEGTARATTYAHRTTRIFWRLRWKVA